MADSYRADYAAVAYKLADELRPYCERMEVAGSIRRGKADPHDIEIVAIPRIEAVPLPAAGQLHLGGDDEPQFDHRNLLDEELCRWKQDGRLADRPDKNGRPAWGERFKRTLLIEQGQRIPLDIFSVLPPAQWGVLFAIRTGPAEFSHLLVTSKLEGGAMPLGLQVKGGALWSWEWSWEGTHGELEALPVPTPQEPDFFREIGLPCWSPALRTLARLKAQLAVPAKSDR